MCNTGGTYTAIATSDHEAVPQDKQLCSALPSFVTGKTNTNTQPVHCR